MAVDDASRLSGNGGFGGNGGKNRFLYIYSQKCHSVVIY